MCRRDEHASACRDKGGAALLRPFACKPRQDARFCKLIKSLRMPRFILIAITALLLAACATGPQPHASAQADAIPTCTLPQLIPGHQLYRDTDRAASAMIIPPYDVQRATARLDAILADAPHDVQALVERGYLAARAGNARETQRYYKRAFAVAPANEHAYWSYGWSLLDLGHPTCAIVAWQGAALLHGGHPSWLPYSLAMGYWRAGDRARAIAWYAVAARSLPQYWGDAKAVKKYTHFWSPRERATIEQIFRSWSATRPPHGST